MDAEPNSNWIDAEDTSLDEWLRLVFNPPEGKLFVQRAFPTPRLRDEYLAKIHSLSDEDVQGLLNVFLIKSCTLGLRDEVNFQLLLHAHESDRSLYTRMISHGYYRRLVNYFKVSKIILPWEGITWVLDLLPHSPRAALEGLNAYISANINVLPDWPLHGLFDAAELIRAKYIGYPGTQEEKRKLLLTLVPRQFENLTERLYASMGYNTRITAPSRDGGYDVIATLDSPFKKERILIECKRYDKPVGVSVVRGLYGVLLSEKANRGVIVSSGAFTYGAQKFANENNMQLIAGEDVVLLLNEYLGANWPQKIDRIVAESEKQYQEGLLSFEPIGD